MFDFLLKKRGTGVLFCLSLFLTALCLSFIWPHDFSWMGYSNVLNSGDTAQHVSGWYAFVNAPWQFPLLKTTLFDYPVGTNISLTDSIPLFALIFKMIRVLLPSGFNYFSVFFIFCYVTQALAAVTLALSLKQKNILAVATFTLFAITMPILNTQIGAEDSLACQAFILFALALYFLNHEGRLSLRQVHIYFCLIIGLSLLVHPYLTAMCYPFYLGVIFEYHKRCRSGKVILKYSLGMHGVILLEFLFFGLGAGTQGVDGFGWLAMNLLSPFYGGILLHDQSVPIRAGQADVFCYLGLGLVFAIVFGLCLLKANFQKTLKQYLPLCVIGVLFFVYSIYGAIYFGTFKIAEFGVPHFFLTYAFRSQGRFFWPCSYILLAFALAILLKKMPKVSCFLLPVLFGVQIFDVSGYLLATKQTLEANMQAAPHNKDLIVKMISKSKIVIVYPEMACPGFGGDNWIAKVQLLSAQSGVPINTAYTAHYESGVNCQDQGSQFKALRPALLVSPVDMASPTIQNILKVDPARCQVVDQAYYCEEL